MYKSSNFAFQSFVSKFMGGVVLLCSIHFVMFQEAFETGCFFVSHHTHTHLLTYLLSHIKAIYSGILALILAGAFSLFFKFPTLFHRGKTEEVYCLRIYLLLDSVVIIVVETINQCESKFFKNQPHGIYN